jgi:hypothetical protein
LPSCGTCSSPEVCGGNGTTGVCDLRSFPFPPTNFDPAGPGIRPPKTAVAVFDCGPSPSIFDSTTNTFTNWCNEPQPTPVELSPNGPVVLSFAGLTVSGGSTLKFVGTRPVIVAVFGDARILGTFTADASGATPGAGGNQACGTSAGTDGMGVLFTGTGGGGGGAFATRGADGGNGNGLSADNRGFGGQIRGSTSLAPLIGGCGGGTGGGCTNPTLGGAGGGAIQLSVSGNLQVNGVISANGGEGANGCSGLGAVGGGGGGGSGGAILIEANDLTIAFGAGISANGNRGGNGVAGGGGGGGGNLFGPPVNGQSHADNGGGGGGGSAGRIRLRHHTRCANQGGISPAPASTTCP